MMLREGEIIVDSFAGGGGASTGIEMALGRSPDIAINHDEEALALHAANHPHTLHVSKNVWQVDPFEAVGKRKVGLLWASPDCKHFSKAKGGKPVKRNIRDLAWVVVRWAREVRPRVIMLENVEEFRGWGPLLKRGDGKLVPDPERSGETFDRWVAELTRLGYVVEWRELRACDYGAPTIRKRLFLIARCDGLAIEWPEPTHAAPGDAEVIAGLKQPWRTAAEIIDWSLTCPSIFLTREQGRAIGCNRPLADATMARIAKGVKRYVLDAAKPFIVNITHTDPRVNSVDEPLRTVTGAHRGEKALVVPTFAGCGGRAGQSRPRSADEPTATQTSKGDACLVTAHLNAHYGEGNGGTNRSASAEEPLRTITCDPRHSVVAAFLAQHNLGVVGHAATEPLSTITQRGTQQNVVSAGLVNMKGAKRAGYDIETPVPTICAQTVHAAEVRAFLVKYFGSAIGQSLDDPAHTATSKARFGLVMVDGQPYEIADIGMRMLSPRELFRAQGFPDSYVIDPVVNGKKLTKTAQIRMCGNSVCPPIAAALVRANFAADAARDQEVAAA